jgi:large conductance mechanosensitive channel
MIVPDIVLSSNDGLRFRRKHDTEDHIIECTNYYFPPKKMQLSLAPCCAAQGRFFLPAEEIPAISLLRGFTCYDRCGSWTSIWSSCHAWGIKKFALRGNVVDLVVGVIIGTAFGLIVSSMVNDIIMPVIGAVTGGLDFSNYYLPLNSAVKSGLPLADAKKSGAVLAYGNFITITLNFLIIAFVLFLAIRGMNTIIKKDEAKPAEPSVSEKLLTEIRDILARRH